jgi:two-component system KDP operon response regulator KdpE
LIRAAMDRPELIIHDLGLPDAEGIDILRKLRTSSTTPVVILTVRNAEQDIIQSLDSGADDYVTKPFRTGELIARVHAALRHRAAEPTEPMYSIGSLEVNLDARSVKKNAEVVKLTATEYSLLALFVRNAGRVLTHRYILEHVWGQAYAEETQYSRVYVAQLRKKLEDDPSNPKLILTESGIGYRFMGE